MLDINEFRIEKGGNLEKIKVSQRKRNASVELVDKVVEADKDWVKLRFQVDEINKKINVTQKEIGQKYKNKENADDLIAKKSELEKERETKKVELDEKEKERDRNLMLIGNIVHESVVESNDEKNNNIIKEWDGKTKEVKEGILPHNHVLERLSGFDSDRGAKIAGHRGYFLLDDGLDLNLALIRYGLDFLQKRGYKKIQTPFFMNRDVMAKTAQLEQFDEELYKVTGEGEDKYLIATSEQPISAFHMGEWFEKPSEDLPIKYAGYSTCFRKEAGAHGKDTWGIFRVHQFEKIEQFCITEPEKSWEMFDSMIQTSEEFMQSLGFSYRIVSIVSGALNNAAAKKYDLEAWFPYQKEYKELVSCSNCTDYQSRNLEVRCGMKKLNQSEKKYVHMLNSTLCATERTLCCLIENYQTPDGVVVPEVLRPYMGGKEFLPFSAPLKTKK
jgi:seryl-tRNA synthetase